MTIQNLKRSMCTKARSNCHIIQMGERIIDLFKNWENQNLISGKNYDKSFSLVLQPGGPYRFGKLPFNVFHNTHTQLQVGKKLKTLLI